MTAKVVETIEDVRVVVRLTDRTCPENGKDTVEWIRRHDLVSRIMQLLGAADINAHVLLEYDRVSRCSACGDRYEEIRYSAEDTDGPTGLGCANCGEIHKPDAAWLETESLRTTGKERSMDPYWTSRDGRHCLYLGDCLDVLPGMEPGSVITDPPYGISHATHGQWFRSATPIAGDDTTELAEIVFEWFRARNTTMCMFYSPYKPFGDWRSVLVWNKGAHVGIGGDRETCWKRDFEMIGVRDNSPLNGMRDSAVLSFMALLPPPSGHFAEKPVPLMEYLVEKLTQPGDTVFDPFAGSATTGVACIRTGRRFVGVEIERRYADIAVRRMERELSQPHLPGLAPHEAVDEVRELFGEGTQ